MRIESFGRVVFWLGSAQGVFSTMSDLSHIYFAGIDPPARPARAAVPLLYPLANTAPPGQSPEVGISSSFLDWLLAEAGLNAALYRPVALRRRLPACLRTLRVSCVEAAQALLDEMPSMRAKAVDTLLIGVSDFFRDPAVFECLRQQILPELFTTRRGLRVYSAGCSAGQELYSIAILLAECGVLAESSLLGVDCRPEAIAQAQEGLFQEAELKQLPWQYRQRYFRLEGSRWAVAPDLRRRIQWRVTDLAGEAFVGGWDLLLFRNIAIYLKPNEATPLWKRLTGLLAPGGVLVTGKAERPPPSLPLRRISPCVYRKIET